ncbi:NAD(P)-dependent oxidoreductase [Anaerolineae bacterium CFX7]|nr:NAD(P)-dependent oxidoreductase [Anaerolineae bacterium CFX7]
MRIALIGPTGVLGRALAPLLLQKGYTVRALARSAAKARATLPQALEIVECDLLATNADTLAPLLQGCDVVAHIATAIPRDFTAPNAWEANTRLRTDGVRTLLDAARQAKVGRYLQQSITMAYPDHGDEWITEDMPLDTTPRRGQVTNPVITMEQMIRDTPLDTLQWCILRGANFVGPDTAQAQTLEALRQGNQVVPCDGRNFVSLIHVADIAAAFVAAIENAPAGSIFNLTAEPLRHGEYLDALADSIGVSRPKRDESVPCPPSWRCSAQAAKTKLRWQPTHPLVP